MGPRLDGTAFPGEVVGTPLAAAEMRRVGQTERLAFSRPINLERLAAPPRPSAGAVET